MPPQLTGILEAALYVNDLARSLGFYQTVFGFEKISDFSERGCALGVAGRQVLLLFNKEVTLKPVETPGGRLGGHGATGSIHVAFAIATEELETWERWLLQNCVAIESKVKWERGGQSLYFRDPDGHALELATPGTWALY